MNHCYFNHFHNESTDYDFEFIHITKRYPFLFQIGPAGHTGVFNLFCVICCFSEDLTQSLFDKKNKTNKQT